MTGQVQADPNREVMIVAGEASGDLHGAHLVKAMLAKSPDLRFCGMGGPELRAAGVNLLYDAAKLAVVGVTEVLTHLGDILRARRTLLHELRTRRPALLILIDYPDFNLLLAAKAKRWGIPIFYYITPQVWAWRKGRVRTIRRLTDRVAVILPFEQAFFANHGVAVDFVGHPLVDTVTATRERPEVCDQLGIEPSRKLIAILPGSREKEVAALLPDFLAAAKLLSHKNPEAYAFLIVQAATVTASTLETSGLASWRSSSLTYRTVSQDRYNMMAACDAAIAASGTVLLELALLGVPTVAAYRISPLTYFLGRLLVRHLQFFSLVNLIADRSIQVELLQKQATPGQIAREIEKLLENEQRCREVREGLHEVRQKLGTPGASARAADIALELLAGKGHGHGHSDDTP